MTEPAVLAIDQGTTSSRAIVFDLVGTVISLAQQEFPQQFPRDGWVEHDPEHIWQTVVVTSRKAVADAWSAGFDVVAIGIANQRETTVIWDRKSGRPIYNAIVWQDRRGAASCQALVDAGDAPYIREKTGLVVDSFFSGTKLQWLLKKVDGAAAAAQRGDLAFGTIDSFLLWRLTGGAIHVTDATNACRTMLFDIGAQDWDTALCERFGVPQAMLPEVRDSAGSFDATDPDLFGRPIPVAGIVGDQQAAVVGQGCLTAGMAKSTYGTGCFVLINTGTRKPEPQEGILATVAYRLSGETTYALEGSIFNAGVAVNWLRDGLGVIGDAAETEALAASLPGNAGVYMVPAFTGLGAPYWDSEARGGIFGLTRDTTKAHLARAALEACGYQTADLLGVLGGISRLRVDGGMVANDWLLKFVADIANVSVERPRVIETTALGAALLAGVGMGLYASLEDAVEQVWHSDRTFDPSMAEADRMALLSEWRAAVDRIRSTTG
ncbi:MAG: glycerol kinase GlpK [Rhodospirillaceae bacterium]|nr:glycerol kinase GlpK [Rhodospirillaceae bacterium]